MSAYATPLKNSINKTDIPTVSVENIIQNLSVLLSPEPLLSFQVMIKGQLLHLKQQAFFNPEIRFKIEQLIIEGLQKSCRFLTKNKKAHTLLSITPESLLRSTISNEIVILPNANEHRLDEIEYDFEKTLYFALSLSQQLADCFALIKEKKGLRPDHFYKHLCEQTNQFYTAVFHFITPQERAEVWAPLIHYLHNFKKTAINQ